MVDTIRREHLDSFIVKMEELYPDFKGLYEADSCRCCKPDYDNWSAGKLRDWERYDNWRFLRGNEDE